MSAVLAWLSLRLGALFLPLTILMILMVVDYISGMLASKMDSPCGMSATSTGLLLRSLNLRRNPRAARSNELGSWLRKEKAPWKES